MSGGRIEAGRQLEKPLHRTDRRATGDPALILSSRAVRSRYSPHASDLMLYPAAAGLGLLAGYSVLMSPSLVKLLLLLPGLVFAVTVSPEKLFVGWLFCAPFVDGAASGDHSGHAFYRFLFLVPPVILLARMSTGELRRSRLWAIDLLPALYVAYIVVRVELLPSAFTGTAASPRGIYTGVGIAAISYYFAAFARTTDRFPVRVASSLLWSGIIVSVLALVDAATGWNLWNTVEAGEGTATRRVVSTFASPGALGAYIGAGVVFSVAILAWNGPHSLRRPAILLIPLSIPALFFTLLARPGAWGSDGCCRHGSGGESGTLAEPARSRDGRNLSVCGLGTDHVQLHLPRPAGRDGNRDDS